MAAHKHGGDDVDGAPSGDAGHDARHGPGQEDAEQQPGHHHAHHPTAAVVVGEGGGHRDEHLGDRGTGPHHQGHEDEESDVRGQ